MSVHMCMTNPCDVCGRGTTGNPSTLTVEYAGTHFYPCDMGQGGLPIGYHHFEANAHGTACRYCGATPKAAS